MNLRLSTNVTERAFVEQTAFFAGDSVAPNAMTADNDEVFRERSFAVLRWWCRERILHDVAILEKLDVSGEWWSFAKIINLL